jgi:hypothetical protein
MNKRPGVKLAVRQLLGFKHDRNRIQRAFNLLLEQLVKTPVSRRGCLVIDPFEPALISLPANPDVRFA